VEFLDDQPDSGRVIQPYIRNLEAIGVSAVLRIVDTAQLQNRLGDFDFDIVNSWNLQSLMPGAEQRDLFGSAAAHTPNSGNVAGLQSPVVDALIDQIVAAKSRPALVAAARAMDRVLLWEYLCVPLWTIGGFPCAYWNRFGFPTERLHLGGLPAVWWSTERREAGPASHGGGAG
jgi:microcin C transport system substrate-binding protein